ncbi:MAG TPA: hypothetical protein VJ455_01180 [Ignavibacteria bacterium]|nr:hypothetical protein [Ignavibacteria bacterium]
MTSGPSKEELENYWKTSRQYFDELARHYQTADPEYYRKFIAPFYINPLYSVSSGKSSSGGVRAVLVSVFTFIAILTAGIAIFFVVKNEPENTDYKEIKKNTTEETKPTQKEDMGFPDDDFILGSKYIAEKDYDKAEEHLKKIKPGSKNYEQAQQLLESIKYLRKYDK